MKEVRRDEIQSPKRVPSTIMRHTNFNIISTTKDISIFKSRIEDLRRPFLMINEFESKSSFTEYAFSKGALSILHEPNAGGNSVESEVLSFEVLKRCFGARLHKTEMELAYFPYGSKKTDYSILLDGHRVGVSVTRAMHFYDPRLFTVQDAKHLLKKKLDGIIWSTRNILGRDKWKRQILHVWVQSKGVAKKVKAAYRTMKSDLRINTIVVVTVAQNADFIFTNKRKQFLEAREPFVAKSRSRASTH